MLSAPAAPISNRVLNRALLARQMLLAREKTTVTGAIERLAGMQAQVARPPFIGLWTRLAKFDRSDLLAAIRAKKVVRVTAMRATLHLMTSADYVKLRGALQPALTRIAKSRNTVIDLDRIDAEGRAFFGRAPAPFDAVRNALKNDLPGAPRPREDTPAPVRFLPDFDNVILSHDDRTRIVAAEHRPFITTKNLLVPGTFLVDGMVAGTWKIERKKQTATLVLKPFAKLPKTAQAELAAEGEALLAFAEPDAAHRDVKPG